MFSAYFPILCFHHNFLHCMEHFLSLSDLCLSLIFIRRARVLVVEVSLHRKRDGVEGQGI